MRRAEQEWPLARTRWTRLQLDASGGALTDLAPAPAEATFDAREDGLTFSTPPLEAETEITGPLAARLFVSSTTTDADLFLILRVFGPGR